MTHNKRVDSKTQALYAIELLLCSDPVEGLEYEVGMKRIKDKKLIDASKILSKIYRIAHSEISSCVHEAWAEEKYRVLKVNGVLIEEKKNA